MAGDQNQTGQPGAGPDTAKDNFSLSDLASAAEQILEQLGKVKAATEKLGRQLSAEEHTRRIEEISAAVGTLDRLAPQTWMEAQLSPQTEKIKSAIGLLTLTLSAGAWEPQLKVIEAAVEAMTALATQEKATAEKLAQDTLPLAAQERFRKEIDAACDLLNFAITEGKLGISDSMIEQITKAQRFLGQKTVPTWSDCAAFAKAYRELAQVLSPISAEGVRAVSPLQWGKEYLSLPFILGAPFLAALFFSGSWGCAQETQAQGPTLCTQQTFATWPVFVGGGLAVFLLWGLYVFTGVVTNRKLNQIVFFCYMFTVFALGASVVPFLTFVPELPDWMERSPISIIPGCAEDLSMQGFVSQGSAPSGTVPQTQPTIPREIRCQDGKGAYQWVINIGGAVSPAPAPSGTLAVPIKQLQDHAQSPAEGQLRMISAVGDVGQTSRPMKPRPEDQEGYWHIQGGLVIPLYVVVLSLMGSAVSMTRRVPEYQRRALDLKEPFTNAQARECLVFQIMQVVSAPLIGMTVYYLYGPDTPAKSVFLGFASGFASEPILISIRGLVEKLKRAESVSSPAATGPVAVAVSPGEISLKAKGIATFTAVVTYAANPGVTWSMSPADASAGGIEQAGVATVRYTAPDKIGTAQTVTITARSAADPAKSGSATIKLVPGD
jgi:hypothetical protein